MSDKHDYTDRHFDVNVYDKEYFEGGGTKSGYGSYIDAKGIITDQFEMIHNLMQSKTDNHTSLELACAYGYGVDYLRSKGWESEGFDISEWAISQASSDKVFVADAMDKKFWSGIKKKYGLTIAVEFFEHIESQDVEAIIKELARTSEWGFYVVNGRTSPEQDLMSIHGDHGHLNNHNMSWWVKEFSKYGQLDWDTMFEFSKLAEAYNKEVHWHNRCIIVKYD